MGVFFIVFLMTESAYGDSLFACLLFLLGTVLVGVATVGRLWCAVYISGYKDCELVTAGPYSISRNPLYFFSLLGFAGVGFATETLTLGLALVAVYLFCCPSVIRREESSLRERFGSRYESYCLRTPRFFPNLAALSEPAIYRVKPKPFRRALGDVVWFVWLIGLIQLVDELHEVHLIKALFQLH